MELCRWSSCFHLVVASCQVLLAVYGVTAAHDYFLDPVFFKVLSPRSVNYIFKTLPAKDFGGSFGTQPRRSYVIPAQPALACVSLSNGEAVNGMILLAERGDCSFVSKAIVAQNHNAVGLVIYDKSVDDFRHFIDMIDDETGRSGEITIPVVFLQGRDGHYLKEALQEEGMPAAEVLIPLNLTRQPDLLHHHPPWSIY